MNHKKLRRLWREEGLRRPPPKKQKKRRPGGLDGSLLTAEHPNHVWGLDFEFDETADLRRLKLLNIVDEHTREALAMDVDRSITGDDIVTVLERLVAERGAPRYVRMDNGPELIAWILRDWCRLRGLGTIYIEPGSPWQNPWVESHIRPGQRRTLEHHRIRIPRRSEGAHRRLEERIQRLEAAQQSRRAHARRVR